MTARNLYLVLLAAGVAALSCAGPRGSRSWILPETAEAERCYEECKESRRLCSNRPLRSDMMPERSPPSTSWTVPVDDDARQRYAQCETAFDGCVAGCPGAERRH